MRRKLLIAALAFGTVAGYGSALRHMGRCNRDRHQSFERHVAKICTEAARTERYERYEKSEK